MMMSHGTCKQTVSALSTSVMRNEISVLEEEEKSEKGQSLRECCQGIRANNACTLSPMTQTGSLTSKRMWKRKTELIVYISLLNKTCILGLATVSMIQTRLYGPHEIHFTYYFW